MVLSTTLNSKHCLEFAFTIAYSDAFTIAYQLAFDG